MAHLLIIKKDSGFSKQYLFEYAYDRDDATTQLLAIGVWNQTYVYVKDNEYSAVILEEISGCPAACTPPTPTMSMARDIGK